MQEDQVVIGPSKVGHELSSDYHQSPIIDLRFANTTFITSTPNSTLGGSNSDDLDINFSLPATPPGYHYSLKDMVLMVDLQLCLRNGNPIPKNTQIGVHNGVLFSCFRAMTIKLNDVAVNTYDGLYAHRAYLELLLGSSPEARETQLSETIGYTRDVPDQFTSNQVSSYLKRIRRFTNHVIVNEDKKTQRLTYEIDWKDSPTRFIGLLVSDLASITTPLPNGVKVDIELKQTLHSQRVFRKTPDDIEEYRLSVKQAKLYVKQYVLSVRAADAFKAKIIKNPAIYNFREMKFQTICIPTGSEEYNSNSLNLGVGNLPARLFLVFNFTNVLAGDYTSSPFDYRRDFLITPVTPNVAAARPTSAPGSPAPPAPPAQAQAFQEPRPPPLPPRRRYWQRHESVGSSQSGSTQTSQSTNSFFTSVKNAMSRLAFRSRRGDDEIYENITFREPSRPSLFPRRQAPPPPTPTPPRFFTYPLGLPTGPASISSLPSRPGSTIPPESEPARPDPDVIRTVYHGKDPLDDSDDLQFSIITDITITDATFADVPFTALNDKDPIVDFFRFYYYQGAYRNKHTSCGINYGDFTKSYYVKIFDLTASNEGYNTRLRPSLKRGAGINVKVKFSRPTPKEITCIIASEQPATFVINHNGKVVKVSVQDK